MAERAVTEAVGSPGVLLRLAQGLSRVSLLHDGAVCCSELFLTA